MDFFQLAVPGKEFRFIEQVGKLIKDDSRYSRKCLLRILFYFTTITEQSESVSLYQG